MRGPGEAGVFPSSPARLYRGLSAPGSLCQCLRTSSPLFRGPGGPACCSPFLSPLSVLPCFSAAKLGPLAPVLLLGWGQDYCHRIPWSPSLGTVDTKCLSQSPLLPTQLSQGQGYHHPQLLPGLACRLLWSRLVQKEPVASHPHSSLGTDRAPTSFCLGRGGPRGKKLLPLEKGARVFPSGPHSPASPRLMAAPYVTQAVTLPSALITKRPWSLAPRF